MTNCKLMKNLFNYLFINTILLSSCTPSPSPANEEQASSSDSTPATIEHKQEPIETYILQGKTFYQELTGNGKVTASRSAEVRFKTVERIAHVWERSALCSRGVCDKGRGSIL